MATVKASTILFAAAEYAERFGCAGCEAIDDVDHTRYEHRNSSAYYARRRARRYQASLFKNEMLYWFGMPSFTHCQDHRVIALLMAATMAAGAGD